MWNEGVSGSGVWTQACMWAMHVHVRACMWAWAMHVHVRACVWVWAMHVHVCVYVWAWAVCVHVTNRDSRTSEARDHGKVT